MNQITDINEFVLLSSQLVNIISSYSQSIPPYTRDYDIDYSNLHVARIDLLDKWTDIEDIDFVTYLTLAQKSIDLTRTEALQKSKFMYRVAFRALTNEEQLERH